MDLNNVIDDSPRGSGRVRATSERSKGAAERPLQLLFPSANTRGPVPNPAGAPHCKTTQAHRMFMETSGHTKSATSARPLLETESTPYRLSRQNRMYIDLVTPRATRPAAPATPMKGHKARVPLADKSAHNTPCTDSDLLDKRNHRRSSNRNPTSKPKSARSKSGKGLAPSPVQLKAPQKIEVIDLDSDGETGQCPHPPTHRDAEFVASVNKEIRCRKPRAVPPRGRLKRVIISDDESEPEEPILEAEPKHVGQETQPGSEKAPLIRPGPTFTTQPPKPVQTPLPVSASTVPRRIPLSYRAL